MLKNLLSFREELSFHHARKKESRNPSHGLVGQHRLMLPTTFFALGRQQRKAVGRRPRKHVITLLKFIEIGYYMALHYTIDDH